MIFRSCLHTGGGDPARRLEYHAPNAICHFIFLLYFLKLFWKHIFNPHQKSSLLLLLLPMIFLKIELSFSLMSSFIQVVVILPSNRKDRYDAIKKTCVVTHPCPSQVIVSRTLSKQQMLMSVATKIAMQMNCKMGGDLWRVEIPVSRSFTHQNVTM